MKRTVVLLLALITMPFLGKAQEVYRVSLSGINKVEFSTNSDVRVEKGTGNELVLKYQDGKAGKENEKENDARAQGLTPIYAAGVDNTGSGFQVEQKGDVLRLKDLKPLIHSRALTLILPNGIDLHLDCGQIGGAQINGFSSEIVVNTSLGDITMSEVTGPIVAHSSGGNIEISFSKVFQEAPTSISSSLGVIDVSIPADTRADVQLKSTMGTVYSNFELEAPREDGLQVVGANRDIEGKLNNGGVSISLRASAGNIYFRKQQTN